MDRRAAWLVLLGVLLLAALLRFTRLDAQSLWNDEGNSVRIAERPLRLILEGAEGDIHPPAYYVLLSRWRPIFGQSEFAFRSLSVLAGMGMVLFTYLLGREVFDQTSALAAAFVAAISPFAVYYSQEARMYALLGALSAASTYLLLRLLRETGCAGPGLRPPDTPQRRRGIAAAYVVLSAAALYVHYAFPFVLLAHNVVFCLWWLVLRRRSRDRWRWLAAWAAMQATVLTLFTPWIRIALSSIGGWPRSGAPRAFWSETLSVLRVLSVGTTLPAERATPALVGAGLFVFAGLWPMRPDRLRGMGRTAMAVCLLLPIMLFLGLGLRKPDYLKFLIIALPPFHVIVGRGIANLGRWLAPPSSVSIRRGRALVQVVACALVAVGVLPSLTNLYFDPAYARDDYRQIAADIVAQARPADRVVLSAPNQWEVFTYYYPDAGVYPAPYRPAQEQVDQYLAPLVSRPGRLYALFWGDDESDPEHLVEAGLAERAFKAGDRWYGQVRLATYATAELPAVASREMDVSFGRDIHLLGAAYQEGPYARCEILPLTLFWRADAPVQERYKVTVQLIDEAGQLAGQYDTEPGDGLWPTTLWQVAQVVVDRYGVLVPSAAPPGVCRLIVAMYDPATGERLPVAVAGDIVGDHLQLGTVEVEA